MRTTALACNLRKAFRHFETGCSQLDLSASQIGILNSFLRSESLFLLEAESFFPIVWQGFDFFDFGWLDWHLSSCPRDQALEQSLNNWLTCDCVAGLREAEILQHHPLMLSHLAYQSKDTWHLKSVWISAWSAGNFMILTPNYRLVVSYSFPTETNTSSWTHGHLSCLCSPRLWAYSTAALNRGVSLDLRNSRHSFDLDLWPVARQEQAAWSASRPLYFACDSLSEACRALAAYWSATFLPDSSRQETTAAISSSYLQTDSSLAR